MDKVTIQRLQHLERTISWLLEIPNEFNRRRLVSDNQLVKLIDEKLRIYEEEY